MDVRRIARHLAMTHRRVRRAFPERTLAAIDRAIRASEGAHVGEVRFAVEGALEIAPLVRGQSPRARAIEIFSQLRIWDTERNNGVLIYLLFADRAVEIVADRGIHAKVAPREWETICRAMETDFRKAEYEGGVLRGIREVTRHLAAHFPPSGDDRNELPDKPAVL
jgi:TPM domain